MSAADRLKDEMEQPGELPFSDDYLASCFSAEHADILLYEAEWSRWYRWGGQQWREEQTVRVFELVRLRCRAIAAGCNEGGKGLVRAATITGVEKLARGDERHRPKADAWDMDGGMLNTEAMSVNLITGEHYAPRREDYCTKLAPVRFKAGATCPLWDKFLDRVTNSDTELQEYLARVVGYWLTGHTHEHVLFFLYGTGGNGKGVFIDTIADMLGDYATTAPPGTFLSSRWDRHPTEIAGLRGVRLVVADEVEEGRRWNEARIKQLTGGGKVKARFMRQDFFEFTPQFKICVVGNNKPGLRSVDEAIRRRLHLIPFTVTITEEERDRHLKDKLKAEWSGILNWALAGCKAWREGGLRPPKAVLGATDDYLAEEDILASWVSDRCHLELGAKTRSSELFRSFREWCEANNERLTTQKAFSQKLESHGYHKKRELDAVYFHGIRL